MPNLVERRPMSWVFIKKFRERKLIKVENTMNSTVYIDNLVSNFFPSYILGQNFTAGFYAPAHKSEETQTWFSENVVGLLEKWPPISKDLNIIENLWSILKGRVAKRHTKTWMIFKNSFWKNFMPSQTFMSRNFQIDKNSLDLTKINQSRLTRY